MALTVGGPDVARFPWMLAQATAEGVPVITVVTDHLERPAVCFEVVPHPRSTTALEEAPCLGIGADAALKAVGRVIGTAHRTVTFAARAARIGPIRTRTAATRHRGPRQRAARAGYRCKTARAGYCARRADPSMPGGLAKRCFDGRGWLTWFIAPRW